MRRWWDGLGEERFWLEITDRDDLGVDLKAPQAGDNGGEVWSYSLVREFGEGDVVFHYWKPESAIYAWSRAVGSWWEEDIVWASHGTVAREAGVLPYRRAGWRIGLEDLALLDRPVTLDEIRAEELALRDIAADLGARFGSPLYFPVALSDRRPPRMQQAYLTKLPASVVAHFPSLAEGARRAALTTRVEFTEPSPARRSAVGVEYREADEDASTSERDAFAVDPAVVERGLRGHAATQNAVAEWVRSQGMMPRSPRPEEPNFDLAWSDGNTVWVVEVKSTTVSNEEKQLRLGLGQLLRYRQILGSHSTCEGVLAVEREPSDPSWQDLCTALGIRLVWPGHFD